MDGAMSVKSASAASAGMYSFAELSISSPASLLTIIQSPISTTMLMATLR